MTPRDERHQVSSGRASEATTGRLRGALRREVGDLEVRLEEAQLRSSAFRSAGLDREAAEVLEESRAMVDAFHRRLEASLAEAAVEREAERIFAGSEDILDVLGDPSHEGRFLTRIPAGIGAAVASLAVFAMAIVSLRAPEARDLQTAADIAALPAPSSSDAVPGPGRTFSPRVEALAESMSAAELEVLAGSSTPDTVAPLLERRRQLLDRLAAGAQPISSTVLAELDSLVAKLRTEGVDVDRLMLLERVGKYRASEDGGQASAADEQMDEPSPGQPDPAAEPADPEPEPEPEPEPQPEEDPSSEEESVFPFNEPSEGEEPEPNPSDGDSSGGDDSTTAEGESPSDDDGLLD